MSFLGSLSRSMSRAPRPPRRSTTPTSATFPSNSTESLPSPSPTSAQPATPKPLYLCSPFVEAALVKGNFKTIVMQPKYTDIMEWVAVNIFEFYQNLNQFYGVLAECCTQQSCPAMSAGPQYVPSRIPRGYFLTQNPRLNYTWINQDRKSVQLPAPTYIDYVMTWVQNLLDDENAFPTKSGRDFPSNFPSTVKHVYRQLLRVFAHLYHAHYPQILHLRSEPHFNSLFAHFLAFGKEYELLDVKDIKGQSGAVVGVGALWERWKEMGILEQ
ncbi:Mob1/phocein [Irpex rosettiformis]|uniref:Mob1/phocein n=1 Tax=Irpex rosettiformis TaxID=378272 RepID=A0ACB8TYZ4_9APHY|nr:Mob1/phocein [Irpex rosettiformis]